VKDGGARNGCRRSGNDRLAEGAGLESDCDVEPMKHLKNINQPKDEYSSDGDLLGSSDLVDFSKGPRPAKRLLAVAIEVREQTDVAERAVKGDTISTRAISSF
jgi:hypothetical protein